MVLQGNEFYEEGIDFENPEKLLTIVEKWIEKRKSEGWQNASEFSLRRFIEKGYD
jgi:hypothetical protein